MNNNSSGTAGSGSASNSQPRSAWAAFFVCGIAAVLTILDSVKVNVILTPIQDSLGTSSAETQLIVAAYLLAFGIMLVPSGRLGDQWSRKGMFMIGLLMFWAASAATALAPTSTVLVLGRILQGISAGILMPQVLGIIQDLFQGEARGRALGWFGSVIGLGTALGPTIGGLFVGALGDEAGWRWTFGMNVPIVLVLVPFAIWLLPKKHQHAQETPGVRDHRSLDLVGVTLMAITVLLLMMPFVLTSGTDNDNPHRWWLLLAGGVSGFLFVWWENHYKASGKSPALDFSLFQYPSYRNGIILTTLWFAIMPAAMLLMTLYNQQALGHTALAVGLISIPYALVNAITAGVVGRFTHRYATQLVIRGYILFTVGMIGLAIAARLVPAEYMPLAFALILAVAGVGPGMVMAANQMRTLSHVPLAQAGVGGSFQQVGQRIGNAVGISIATSVFYGLTAGIPRATPGQVGSLDGGSTHTFMTAFDVAMLILIGIAAVALIVAFLDHRARRRREKNAG